MSETVLSVRDLGRRFGSEGDFVTRALRRVGLAPPPAVVHAVEDVSFDLKAGEVLGVVGESGCGKSTLGRMVAGLLEPTSGTIDRPEAKGAALPMQMIFQDPFSSLNPRKRVKSLIGEAPRVHRLTTPAEADTYVADLMERCGIDPSYGDRFPHAFSGGQRQRVGIARALLQNPDILLVDEPTASLDPKTSRQIMRLICEICAERDLAAIINIHDVPLAQMFAQRIVGLRAGEIVYDGPPEGLTDAVLTEIYGEEDWTLANQGDQESEEAGPRLDEERLAGVI